MLIHRVIAARADVSVPGPGRTTGGAQARGPSCLPRVESVIVATPARFLTPAYLVGVVRYERATRQAQRAPGSREGEEPLASGRRAPEADVAVERASTRALGCVTEALRAAGASADEVTRVTAGLEPMISALRVQDLHARLRSK